jgi:hypothetical protein
MKLKYIAFTIIDGAIWLGFRLAGRDVHIENDAPGLFLDFARDGGERGEWEFWGLGLHLVTSPLKLRRRPS